MPGNACRGYTAAGRGARRRGPPAPLLHRRRALLLLLLLLAQGQHQAFFSLLKAVRTARLFLDFAAAALYLGGQGRREAGRRAGQRRLPSASALSPSRCRRSQPPLQARPRHCLGRGGCAPRRPRNAPVPSPPPSPPWPRTGQSRTCRPWLPAPPASCPTRSRRTCSTRLGGSGAGAGRGGAGSREGRGALGRSGHASCCGRARPASCCGVLLTTTLAGGWPAATRGPLDCALHGCALAAAADQAGHAARAGSACPLLPPSPPPARLPPAAGLPRAAAA
jgi:hypothetical protein